MANHHTPFQVSTCPKIRNESVIRNMHDNAGLLGLGSLATGDTQISRGLLVRMSRSVRPASSLFFLSGIVLAARSSSLP